MTDILFETIKDSNNFSLGKITLNRVHALNALNDNMFLQLQSQLKTWQTNPNIKAVLIRSNCERAFCAGGDIRQVYDNRLDHLAWLFDFFRREYDINQLIHHYAKPYIALIHGITMGGGVGISLHGSHVVASLDLRFAMPETSIGFFPDVVTSYHLSRMPNYTGYYLALTGNTISAQEAYHLQLIPNLVAKEKFDALEKKIIETPFFPTEKNKVNAIIHSFVEKMIPPQLRLQIDVIARCFSGETVETIFAALKKERNSFAEETLSQLEKRSPTSLKVTLHQLQCAAQKTFDEVVEMDFHIACHMLKHHDFFEGIRAAIVDKDHHPHWHPEKLSDVLDVDVIKYF